MPALLLRRLGIAWQRSATRLSATPTMIRDAYRFLIPLLLFVAVSAFYTFWLVAATFFLLACFVAFFFRNPRRIVPAGEHFVVSPADGKVVKIAPLAPS